MNDTVKTVVTWLVGAAGLAILAMAIQYWISLNVASQLAQAGIVPQSDVDAMKTRIESLEKVHEKDVERVEDKAERIAQIIMEQ